MPYVLLVFDDCNTPYRTLHKILPKINAKYLYLVSAEVLVKSNSMVGATCKETRATEIRIQRSILTHITSGIKKYHLNSTSIVSRSLITNPKKLFLHHCSALLCDSPLSSELSEFQQITTIKATAEEGGVL